MQVLFKGDPKYNARAAPAIPRSELERLNINHRLITAAQRRGYREYIQKGRLPTWDEIADVVIKAMVEGGVDPEAAKATVPKMIEELKNMGVAGPTGLPWVK
jgi:hypothetical protein